MAGLSRRDLLPLLGAVAAWPLDAVAQQQAIPVVGYLSSKDMAAETTVVEPVRESLAKNGFVDGRNLSIVFHWSEGDYDRLPGQAADLVNRRVGVIVTSGLPATLAAKAATASIPIVFRLAVDPVAFRLVESLNRPGGNLTGVTMLFDPLTPKKLQLLHELVPEAKVIGFLINPKNRNVGSHREHFAAGAQALGLRPTMLLASKSSEIDSAFGEGRQQGVGAILVGDDPFFDVASRHITATAAQSHIPTMYYVRDFVANGGLISYGPSFGEMAHQVGDYAARILKGANPADLPVGQPTKIELVVNAKAAGALGLKLPPALLARADEVIE